MTTKGSVMLAIQQMRRKLQNEKKKILPEKENANFNCPFNRLLPQPLSHHFVTEILYMQPSSPQETRSEKDSNGNISRYRQSKQ